MGAVMENLAGRKAEITNMNHHGDEVSIEALDPDARPDRFRNRSRQPNPRAWRDEPSVPRIRPGSRRNCRPQEWLARQHGRRAKPRPTR